MNHTPFQPILKEYFFQEVNISKYSSGAGGPFIFAMHLSYEINKTLSIKIMCVKCLYILYILTTGTCKS